MTSTGNIAMQGLWTVSCRYWTSADRDLLPLAYTFLADVGGSIGEIIIHETSPQQHMDQFIMPSSRKLIWDGSLNHGRGSWYLCRVSCPMSITAVVTDVAGASRRMSTTVNITRFGCTSRLEPCDPISLVSHLEALLDDVEVGGPDAVMTNYQMLIIALELSDIDLFNLNASDPLATRPPPTANPILPSSARSTTRLAANPAARALAMRRTIGFGVAPASLVDLDLSAEESEQLWSAIAQDVLHRMENREFSHADQISGALLDDQEI